MEFQVVVDKMHFMKIYEAQIAQIHNGFNTIIREFLIQKARLDYFLVSCPNRSVLLTL